MSGRAGKLQKSMHPLVWALYLDLDALWRQIGPFEDPRARLVESLARYVRLTGPHMLPTGPWWETVLRMLLAMQPALGDIPAKEAPRVQRWLQAGRALD